MKKLLLSAIVCVLAMFGTLKAQNTEVVIDGTVGSYETNMNRCAPIFVAVQYSISQQYYTAEEIGVEAGVMKSLSFKTDMMWYEENPRRLEVYMVNTANSSFNGLAMEQVTTDDLVFSGNVTFSSSSWVTIELEKDFNYTGGNVLVCVNDLSSTMCYYDSYFTGFFVPTTDGTRCVWSSAEEIPFDPTTSAITAKETSNVVPSVKFAFEGDAIEEMTSTSLLVYPNPVNDRLYIEAEVEIEEVVVYDVFGRQQELSAISGQQSVVDVTSLNSGVYFVKVVTRNGEMVKRFVKK